MNREYLQWSVGLIISYMNLERTIIPWFKGMIFAQITLAKLSHQEPACVFQYLAQDVEWKKTLSHGCGLIFGTKQSHNRSVQYKQYLIWWQNMIPFWCVPDTKQSKSKLSGHFIPVSWDIFNILHFFVPFSLSTFPLLWGWYRVWKASVTPKAVPYLFGYLGRKSRPLVTLYNRYGQSVFFAKDTGSSLYVSQKPFPSFLDCN